METGFHLLFGARSLVWWLQAVIVWVRVTFQKLSLAEPLFWGHVKPNVRRTVRAGAVQLLIGPGCDARGAAS